MASRQVDVSEDGAELIISFPYDPRLVDVARGLPGRRFDGLTKRWRCPAENASSTRCDGHVNRHCARLLLLLLEFLAVLFFFVFRHSRPP